MLTVGDAIQLIGTVTHNIGSYLFVSINAPGCVSKIAVMNDQSAEALKISDSQSIHDQLQLNDGKVINADGSIICPDNPGTLCNIYFKGSCVTCRNKHLK